MYYPKCMLKLIRSFCLPDEMRHYAVSADRRRFVACSESGDCLLFDQNLQQLEKFKFRTNAKWVQFNGDASLLLVGFAERIDGLRVVGGVSHSFTLPVGGTSLSPCVFSRDEPVVCIASWNSAPVLAAYDLQSLKMIAEHELPSRGGQGYDLVSHPEGEAMAAIAFSGQSEEWLFWAHYKSGRIRIFEQPEIEDISLPNFDPSGAEFVSHHERLGLCRMRFPTGELIGSVQPEDAFSNEDGFNYYMHYLGSNRLLAWQTDLALYEFDLKSLRVARCILSGVDGRTFGENGFFSGQSWMMADGRLLTSDTLMHGRFANRTKTLRLWDASALIEPSTPCDASRPLTKKLLAME
jgi:hypothetical protein